MVLGLKTKKKRISFQVDYIVSVLEIKPWPPSVSLCSVQTVLIQWENGEQNSGFLPPGVPSLNGFEDGKIEFNEFFKLTVTLCTSRKSPAGGGFQKNYLEFSLFEPKKDKAVKGQLLGTATINLAEYGIIKDAETIGTPITIKKMSKGMVQPVLYVTIQPFDNEGIDSVLHLMSEQANEDSELAFTDDDEEGSSQSSKTPSAFDAAGNSPFQIDEMLNFVAVGLNSEIASPRVVQANGKDDKSGRKQIQSSQKESTCGNLSLLGDTERTEQPQNEQEDLISGRKTFSSERDVFSKFSEVATKKQVASRSNTLKFGRRGLDLQSVILPDKLRHMKSVRFPSESTEAVNGPVNISCFPDKAKESSSAMDAKIHETSDKKEKDKKNGKADNKIELESRIQMLEEELREAAALEVGLYSIVAEHVNSKRKVHAPARRLSRFFLHACKVGSQVKRASAARTTVSGLVLVSKACGNDVSRLTFWLSNSIMLRAIVSQINKEELIPTAPCVETKSKGKKSDKRAPPNDPRDSHDDWEDLLTFTIALERIEAWIFSRIIESLWWQSFTPHMQTKAANKKERKLGSKKSQKWRFGLGDQEQGKFSIDLWKKAFQDACERLCPIRAGGHECGCLPMLCRMVMEHLADRLDVAIFNAILRNTDDKMPTDPVSDPISDPKVLPIPAGKSSFGAGAQLKNAVGSWSSSLTDFFSFDEKDSLGNKNESDQKQKLRSEASFKAFPLLNALSDLMMLPLGMLSDYSTRTEVCPLLGGPLIKTVLSNFVPDDFSPNPIPETLLEALDSEDPLEASEECIKNLPWAANPIVYSPMPTGSLSNMIGDINGQYNEKGRSSLLRKSYNSDDELDNLNSPLVSINVENIQIYPASTKSNWTPMGKGGRNVVRYQLLQEVWRNGI
ncbi:hypothetical protein Ancab_021351 [Ancistrocladus abbreviatus]